MNWIDIVCLVIVLVLTLIGVWRGFLKDLFRLIAWAAAIAGAFFANDLLAGVVSRNLDINGFTVTIICICIGFLVPFLTLFMIGHFVQKSIAKTSVGKVNRIFGGIFGLFQAWVICFVFLTILHILPVTGSLHDTRNDSIAYSFYKFNLETLGFSSEEPDLIGMAEKKATELSKEITDKAVEKVKESTAEAAEQAKEAAEKATKDAVDNAKNAAKDAKNAVKEKADNVVNKSTDKVDSLKK